MSNIRSMRIRRSSRPSLQNVVSSLLSPRKSGKGAPQSSAGSGGAIAIIVAFSGIVPSEEVEKFILGNGGDIIFSDGIKKLHTITHLVVGSDELKPRRIKFLAALCVSPENIVGYEWIEESVRRNTFLPPERFHVTARSANNIEQIEMQYDFSMESTFNNAIAALEVGGILFGKSVYVGPGVMGGFGCPSKDEVSALLTASGAVYHDRSTGVKKMMKNQGDVTKLIVISSDKGVPPAVADALDKGAFELNWTDFVSAVLKQDFRFMEASQPSLIDDEYVIDVTQQPETQLKQVGIKVTRQFVKILSIKLNVSPERTISDVSIGDPDRAYLGSNGIFEVYKCVSSLETVVRYVDEEGTIKFESLVPPPEDCHKAIQGNAGRDICLFWDACNTAFASGGTTMQGASNSSHAVAHRRHFFWFNCHDELKLVLFHMLGQERDLVNEFFNENGKFFASECTQPDHAVVKPYDAMEEDEIPIRVGYFGQATTSYPYDPRGESQPF